MNTGNHQIMALSCSDVDGCVKSQGAEHMVFLHKFPIKTLFIWI